MPYTRLTRFGAVAAALLLCAAHFASFEPRTQPVVTDIRYYLYFASQIADGAVPHLDYIGNKTQLAAYVGAFLHRLGSGIGVDPLLAIRIGFLAIAALGGMLLFAIQGRLGGGAVAGFLGLLAYLGFGLLGALPAIGNVPKLLMSVFASVVALCAARGLWFWAGAAGALAFMDWQVGGLAWLAAFVSAAVFGAPRLRACLRVAAGGAAALAPVAAWYAWHATLLAALRQTILTSLAVGFSEETLLTRLERMQALVATACPEQQYLFVAALLGIPLSGVMLWRWRSREEGRLLLPLALFHVGLATYCLFDFDLYGDLFALLHSASFLLGLVWIAAYRALSGASRRSRTAGSLLLLALAVVAARPGALRPALEIRTEYAAPGVTLADQREVAAAIRTRTQGKRLLFLDAAEQLVLLPHRNPLPIAYFNEVTWSELRQAGERPRETLARLLREVDPDAFVYLRSEPPPPEFLERYAVTTIRASRGGYAVWLRERR